MNFSVMNIINICFNAFNCLTMLTILFLSIKKINNTVTRKNFFIVLITIFIFNLADTITWLCEGTSPSWKIPVLHIAHFVYYFASPIIYITFMNFIKGILKDKYLSNKFYILCVSLCLVSVILAFCSCYPGLLYTISEENVYARSQYHIFGIICTFSFYFLCICYIISKKSTMSKKAFFSFLSFPTLPILFYIPQLFFYGIATVNLGLTISTILLYKCINNEIQLDVDEDIKVNSEYFNTKENFSFAEKLKRFIFSYGFSSYSISSIKDELQNNINESLKSVIGFSDILLILLSIGSFFIDKLAPQRTIYLFSALLCLVLFLMYQFATKKKLFLQIVSYIFLILILAANIYKCLAVTPDESPILFICVLFMTPSLFCYMPYIIWLIDFSAVFIYMDLSRIYVTSASAHLDNMYLFILTLIGIVVGYSISKTKITSIYLTKNLDNEVAVKTKQINAMSKEIVTTLTSSIESKDEYTNGHSERVANYSVLLAQKAGWSNTKCDQLWMEAVLHDVGKIGIPDEILKKTSRLTDEEFKIIQSHTIKGAKILENLTSFPKAKEAANFHHERINGRGYPKGLKGSEIPEEAKIVAIADAYDAMTSSRCYRPALANEIVMNELLRGRGTQFDESYLDLFLQLLEEHQGSLIEAI